MKLVFVGNYKNLSEEELKDIIMNPNMNQTMKYEAAIVLKQRKDESG